MKVVKKRADKKNMKSKSAVSSFVLRFHDFLNLDYATMLQLLSFSPRWEVEFLLLSLLSCLVELLEVSLKRTFLRLESLTAVEDDNLFELDKDETPLLASLGTCSRRFSAFFVSVHEPST